MDLLIGAIIFIAGFFTCFFVVKKQIKTEIVTEVKRIKPSFRNPLNTYEVHYEQYKGKSNLYEPQKPKRGEV